MRYLAGCSLLALILAVTFSSEVDRGNASASAATSAVPGRFWGVTPVRLPGDAQFARLNRGHVDTIRFPLYWSQAEPQQGTYDWSHFDAVVKGAARRGIEVLPFVYATPSWAAPDPRTLPVSTKVQRRGWSRFLRAAVGRYGPGGTFWLGREGPRRMPIRTWPVSYTHLTLPTICSV